MFKWFKKLKERQEFNNKVSECLDIIDRSKVLLENDQFQFENYLFKSDDYGDVEKVLLYDFEKDYGLRIVEPIEIDEQYQLSYTSGFWNDDFFSMCERLKEKVIKKETENEILKATKEVEVEKHFRKLLGKEIE